MQLFRAPAPTLTESQATARATQAKAAMEQAETNNRLSPGLMPRSSGPAPIRPIPLYQRTPIGPVLEMVMSHSGTHQAEVARRMRIRPQSLNQYVRKRRAAPSLDWLLHFLSVNGAVMCIVFPDDAGFTAVERAVTEANFTRPYQFQKKPKQGLLDFTITESVIVEEPLSAPLPEPLPEL